MTMPTREQVDHSMWADDITLKYIAGLEATIAEQARAIERLILDREEAVRKMHESANQLVDFVHTEHSALATARDIAWEELRKIREAIGANTEESTYDEVVRLSESLARIELKINELIRVVKYETDVANAYAEELSQIHSILKCVFECPPQSPDDTVTVSMLKGLCLHYLKLAEKGK